MLYALGIVFALFTICTCIGYWMLDWKFKIRWNFILLEDRLIGSFVTGSLIFTMISYFFNLLNIPITFLLIFMTAGSILFLFFRFKKNNFLNTARAYKFNWKDTVFFIFFLSTSYYIASHTTMVSDGLYWWGFKARILYLERQLVHSYLTDPIFIWSHMDYPFYLPVFEAWVYLLNHKIWEPFGAFVSSGFYFILALYIYFCIRRITRTLVGLFLGILFLFTPILMDISHLGYADTILSFFYLMCVLFFYKYLTTKNNLYFYLSIITASGLFWVKKEGFLLYAIYFTIASILLLVRSSERVKKLLLVASGIPALSWLFYLKIYHVPGVDFVSPSIQFMLDHLYRFSEIVIVMRRFLKFTPFWGVFWILFFLSMLLRLSKLKSVSILYILLMVCMPIVVYPSLFIFSSWNPYYEHVRTSLPRLILHVFPLAYITFVILLFPTRNKES